LLGKVVPLQACNLSDLTFCGATTTPLLNASFPNDTLICLTVCNGYGKTGTSLGADSDTRSIGFGWYDHQAGFVIRAFTPTSITSGRGFADCTMPGADIGAQGAPYNSQGTVLFVDPGYYGFAPCANQPFGCVSSTADCGNLAQQCITYTFQVNRIPDSVRVFGIEGAGNPLDGCYPDADMMHCFGCVFPIEWAGIEGILRERTIAVKWSTLAETNSDVFVVERANALGTYEEIGSIGASGNSSVLKRYEFVDLAPMPGVNRYRIVQIDTDGNSSISSSVEVVFDGPAGLSWGAIGPNPAKDFVNLTYYNDRAESLQLTLSSMDGKVVYRQNLSAVAGSNEIHFDLDKIDAAAYQISIQNAGRKASRRLVKL
jgi:hypothetical protein